MVEETIVIQVVDKETEEDSVEEEVETSHLLVVLEVGLVDVLVDSGLVTVIMVVEEVPTMVELIKIMVKELTQELLVDNIKVMDILRLLRTNEL